MIDPEIKDKLLKLDGDLDFKLLIAYLESTGINYIAKQVKYNTSLLGMATFDGVYINLLGFKYYPDQIIYFLFLHETAHAKRLAKDGMAKTIEIMSHDDFNIFFQYIIAEEIIADRFGRIMFKRLTKLNYPIELTQKLELSWNQEAYKEIAKRMFGIAKGSEEGYKQLIESFLL